MHFVKRIRTILYTLTLLMYSAAVFAEVTVGPLELVDSQRVSRTAFIYTYKVQVQNGDSAITNLRATVTSSVPTTVIVDGNLSFGDAGSGAQVTSQDTFSFRQERTASFNPSNLQFAFEFDEATAPSVVITSPESLKTVGASPIQVSGDVSPNDVTLFVNGTETNHSGGKFATLVSLKEGHNTIEARASLGSQVVSDIISISLDLTPPYVTIESHEDGQTVYEDTVTITGLINDIVRGTIEEDQASVKVNGVSAAISNRSYSAAISLTSGLNQVVATGSDQVGNTSSTSITLNYLPPVGARILQIGGGDQTATINEIVAEPLQVQVIDDAGAPLANKTIVFRVIQGSGAVGVGTDKEGRAVVAETDNEGKAQTRFRLGARVGTANHKVRASMVGVDGEAVFNASATGQIGNKLSVNSGNNQRGAVGQVLPEPFVVVVTDAGANVVKGARVRFDVTKGEGRFSNEVSSYETATDSDGRATAEYILGDLTGIDAQRVTATLIDAPDGQVITAGFSATAFVPADPANTTISGVVLDNQDNPIPGVTIHVEGTTRQATVDDQGQFRIAQSPVGPVHLIADGSTAQVEGEYPSLGYNLVTIAGVDNPLPAPIYMVKLDTDNSIYAGPADVVLELPDYPGFKLEIAEGSVTFPDGAREGYISVTPVNASKVPMAPPNGMQPQFIVTIQPAGTKFDPPARLTLPNVDGHPQGAQVEMYSFDHDLEEFVSIGLGTVSENAALVVSNPGVGVIKAGWHCGSQPGGSGCAHSCPVCQDCDGDCNCVPTGSDSRVSEKDNKGDCKKPECQNGAVVQVNDDSDVPENAQECSVCKDGSLSAKDDGSSCDDGKYCTSADGKNPGSDQCKDGKCSGNAIGRSDVVTGTQSYDFSKIKQILDGATLASKFVPGCESSATPSIEGSFSAKSATECCESQQKMVDAVGFEGAVKVTVPQLKCRVPAFSWGVATLTGNLGLGGFGQFSASGYQSPCEENCNWNVSGAIGVDVSGAIGINAISPDVVEVEGGIKGSGTISVTDSCGDISAQGCVGPPSVFGKVTLGGWIGKEISYTFKDYVACYP